LCALQFHDAEIS